MPFSFLDKTGKGHIPHLKNGKIPNEIKWYIVKHVINELETEISQPEKAQITTHPLSPFNAQNT